MHHSTPSGVSAISSSIRSQLESTDDSGLEALEKGLEEKDSDAYEDSPVLQNRNIR